LLIHFVYIFLVVSFPSSLCFQLIAISNQLDFRCDLCYYHPMLYNYYFRNDYFDKYSPFNEYFSYHFSLFNFFISFIDFFLRSRYYYFLIFRDSNFLHSYCFLIHELFFSLISRSHYLFFILCCIQEDLYSFDFVEGKPNYFLDYCAIHINSFHRLRIMSLC
jgi:hypothetical protein